MLHETLQARRPERTKHVFVIDAGTGLQGAAPALPISGVGACYLADKMI
jgi:hypothetical protein